MSILNVNQIQPVGSGQTITVSASDIAASSATVTASNFTGNVTGNINATGISTFNVITGVSTIGVTTIHVTGINDLTFPTAGSLGRRNLIINGSMLVDQRNGGASASPPFGTALDLVILFNKLKTPLQVFSIPGNLQQVQAQHRLAAIMEDCIIQ
jgi:hypothetical protein